MLSFNSFLLLAGCTSSPKQAKNTKSHADMTIDGGSDDLIPVVAALHDQMHTAGNPYEWGGTEQSGVDCSGFVWRTLKDRFNLPMERITTRELLHMGVRVNKRDLRPGDLVFFRTRAGMHVGFTIPIIISFTPRAARRDALFAGQPLLGIGVLSGASSAEGV